MAQIQREDVDDRITFSALKITPARGGHLMERSLGGDVGQLGGHRFQVLPADEQHDAPVRPVVVVGGGVGLDKQQGGAGADCPGQVKLGGGELGCRALVTWWS
jgi:hypothetical protein